MGIEGDIYVSIERPRAKSMTESLERFTADLQQNYNRRITESFVENMLCEYSCSRINDKKKSKYFLFDFDDSLVSQNIFRLWDVRGMYKLQLIDYHGKIHYIEEYVTKLPKDNNGIIEFSTATEYPHQCVRIS